MDKQDNRTMAALVYHGPWNMTLERIEKPTPAAGEVLIEIETVGICGSDVHGFTGQSGRRPNGMIMGHEACGTVVALGAGVTSPGLGARVAIFNIIADQPPTPEEGDASFVQRKIVGVNLYRRGAMAEYLAIPADSAIPVPASVDPALAVLVEPLAVVLHGWNRAAALSSQPRRVAIVGAGTIGLSAALVARSHGAAGVVLIDVIAAKLARAEELGAIGVAAGPDEAPAAVAQRARDALGGAADLVVDAVGNESSFAQALALVKDGGAVLLIGNLAKSIPLPLQTCVTREIGLIGSYGFDRPAFAGALAMLPALKDILTPFIECRCRLEETPSIITAMAKGELRPLKAIIDLLPRAGA